MVLSVDGQQVVQRFEVEGDPERPQTILWGEAYDEMLEIQDLIENASDDDEVREGVVLD